MNHGWGNYMRRIINVTQQSIIAALLVSIGVVVVIANRWIDVTSSTQTSIDMFITVFLGIFYEALPFLTIGALVSAAIHQYVDPTWLTQRIPTSRWGSAMAGALLGIIFPVCECGSVPAARSLVQRGAPMSLGVAFALAAPVLNPIVMISTAVAFVGVFGWSFVLWRFVLTFVVAAGTAMLMPHLQLVATSVATHDAHHPHGDDDIPLVALLSHAIVDWLDMVRYMIAGAMVAAAIQVVVPNEIFFTVATQPLLTMPAAMGLAVVMSICSTVDAFVALSFADRLPAVALMAFLVFGPMIDLKSIPMFAAVFGWRPLARFVTIIAALTMGTCTLAWSIGWL